jgi:beta-glucanase (GH16 family)
MTHRIPSSRAARRSGRRFSPALAAVAATATAAACLIPGSATGAELTATGVNLVANPTFESSTSGWKASSGAALTRTSGHTGSYSGRLTNPSGGSLTMALNDTSNTVALTVQGAQYTATAWLRSSRAGVDAGLRMMEYDNSTLRGKNVASVSLADTSWHKLTVAYVAKTNGASIDLNALGWQVSAGSSIDVDDVTLVKDYTGGTTEPPTVDPVPPPSSTPSGWSLAWSDEFNGTSVDGSKWRVRNGDHNGNEQSCLTSRPQNVAVSGGLLHIRAQREKYSCSGYNASWTSGYLDTIGKMSRTHGRFEMRAKLPTQPNTSKGMWPAFWLRPDDGGDGELDVMESIGSASGEHNYDKISQTLWGDYSGRYPRQTYGVTFPAGSTPSDKFHTYAVEWESGVIRWLVDGGVTWTRTTSNISWLNTIFSRNYNIRLNLQVGGSWPGTPNSSTASPSDFQVDWVRVYKR